MHLNPTVYYIFTAESRSRLEREPSRLILYQAVKQVIGPSSVGYFNGLLNLGQEKKIKFLLLTYCATALAKGCIYIIFIAKVTSFWAWIMLMLLQGVDGPSTIGYSKDYWMTRNITYFNSGHPTSLFFFFFFFLIDHPIYFSNECDRATTFLLIGCQPVSFTFGHYSSSSSSAHAHPE